MNETLSPIQQYIADRYSVGLEPYQQALKQYGLDSSCKRIADIACGPGQWAFAASRVAPDAEVFGFDCNQEEIDFAQRYASDHGFDRLRFQRTDYKELLGAVHENSFDAVMCNCALMYLDREEAFKLFHHLLKPSGTLLLFHNHHIGYYLDKSLKSLCRFSLRHVYSFGLMGLVVHPLERILLGSHEGDTFLTVSYLRKVASRYGISLHEIPNEPQLNYRRSFFRLPYLYSLRGERI